MNTDWVPSLMMWFPSKEYWVASDAMSATHPFSWTDRAVKSQNGDVKGGDLRVAKDLRQRFHVVSGRCLSWRSPASS